MLRFDSTCMWVYLDEAVHWDGHQTDDFRRSELFSVDSTRIEVLHTMAHMCGRGGQLYLNHRISGFGALMSSCSLNNRTNATFASLKTTTHNVIDQQVHCLTVKSGFFFVRRNGHIFITGNSNYDMHAQRTCELVFGDSDGTIDLAKKDAELYQYFYKLRYKTDSRNDWIRKTLSQTSCIVTSCGIRRQFFGIRNRGDIDDAIVREASAVNPQANTTYVTNTALANLWYDPENRRRDGGLFVEPLIQVHDAIAGQYLSAHRPFAATKLRQWFTVPIVVQGVLVNIPVDCKFGPNWKDCKQPL